jgi:hypothetical protein
MNDSPLKNMTRLAKRGFAGILFGLLIVGACAAAFAALAAGITSLSSLTGQKAVSAVALNQGSSPGQSAVSNSSLQGGTSSTQTYTWVSPSTQSASSSLPNGQNNGQTPTIYPNSTQVEIPAASITASNVNSASTNLDDPWGITHMHSPIGDAIDSGGVMLGEHVQHTFGSLLKGVLQTLFLEQNDNTGAGANQS